MLILLILFPAPPRHRRRCVGNSSDGRRPRDARRSRRWRTPMALECRQDGRGIGGVLPRGRVGGARFSPGGVAGASASGVSAAPRRHRSHRRARGCARRDHPCPASTTTSRSRGRRASRCGSARWSIGHATTGFGDGVGRMHRHELPTVDAVACGQPGGRDRRSSRRRTVSRRGRDRRRRSSARSSTPRSAGRAGRCCCSPSSPRRSSSRSGLRASKVLLGIAEERGGRRGAGNAIANTGVAAIRGAPLPATPFSGRGAAGVRGGAGRRGQRYDRQRDRQGLGQANVVDHLLDAACSPGRPARCRSKARSPACSARSRSASPASPLGLIPSRDGSSIVAGATAGALGRELRSARRSKDRVS